MLITEDNREDDNEWELLNFFQPAPPIAMASDIPKFLSVEETHRKYASTNMQICIKFHIHILGSKEIRLGNNHSLKAICSDPRHIYHFA